MSANRQFISLSEACAPFFVGLDVGGTNIKVGVIDDRGRPLSWHSLRTESHLGPEDGARRMGLASLKAIEMAGLKPGDIAAVGLGTPGTMDIPAGMLIDPPNLPGWTNFPIRDRVSHHSGLPVVFANDAGAAAYGEFWVGSGREFRSLVLLTLGTGIGSGIIIDDLLLDGEHSHGGESGHMIIDCRHDARVCSCGQSGHLEAYASAIAVVKRAQEALAMGRVSSLLDRVAAGQALMPLMLSEEAEAGDELSLEIIMETARYIGVGVVSLMHTIDPAVVLIGGAMTFGGPGTALGRQFLETVRDEANRRALPVLAESTKIDFAALGGDAGFIGAAGLARVACRKATGTSVA
jgi:glucokinase